MNEDLFRREFRTIPGPPPRDNLFAWTVVIILLIGVALVCWLGSYYIFGHPEKPESYRILKDVFRKLDPPQRFALTKAPPGNFLSPQKALELYNNMTRFEMERKNAELLRDYICNYQSPKNLVPYITGRYSIMSSYELKSSDFMATGLIVLAQSVETPQVVIEHLYPATHQALPGLEEMLRTGLDIKLDRTQDLSAIIHIARTPDGRLLLTLVPLLYGSYSIKQGEGSGSFSLEPPTQLNVAAGLPVIRGQLYEDALKNYLTYVRKYGLPPGATAVYAPPTTIVQIETPTPVPTATPGREPVATAESTPTPTPAIAQVTPMPTPTPAIAKVPPTPAPAIAPVTPKITPTPTPAIAQGTPTPVPTIVKAVAVATPQPFLAAAATPGATPGSGSWTLHKPGRMPLGRLITLSETNELADRGLRGERYYLQGNFVVSASHGNRAVLRASSSISTALSTLTNTVPPRVVVEYPTGTAAPAQERTFSRDDLRPFEITSVRREANGQVTVYAREITTVE